MRGVGPLVARYRRRPRGAGRKGQLDDVPRRLQRPPSQQPHADDARERSSAHAGVGVRDRPDAVDQGDADPRQWRHLHLGARSRVGDRRAVGASAVALHVSGQRRLPHWPPRNGDLQRLGLPDHARLASDRARREGRQGEVERHDCRCEEGLLVDERAAADSRSPARRRLRRLRQPAGHPHVGRSGDWKNAVDVLQHAAAGHCGQSERRRHRRSDVDDRHLRSRIEPPVRRHRQPHAGSERSGARRRQSVDRQHPRAQSGYGQARVGISGDAPRHARLGRGRSAGSRRRLVQRNASEAADAGIAERLLLRARSHDGTQPPDDDVRDGQLGDGDRSGRASDSESREGTGAGRTSGRARRERRHELSIAELRSEDWRARRQRPRRVRHLFLPIGSRRVRVGRRRLRRVR